jgi:hypothetical protein
MIATLNNNITEKSNRLTRANLSLPNSDGNTLTERMAEPAGLNESSTLKISQAYSLGLIAAQKFEMIYSTLT